MWTTQNAENRWWPNSKWLTNIFQQFIEFPLKYAGHHSYFLDQKEDVIVTCLDQVNIITQPKLEVECNQDIDYREIKISPTNSHYIDPNSSSLRERRKRHYSVSEMAIQPAWRSWIVAILQHHLACYQQQPSLPKILSCQVFQPQIVGSWAQCTPPSWTHFRSRLRCEQCWGRDPTRSAQLFDNYHRQNWDTR